MIEISFDPGCHIQDAALQLVEAAALHGMATGVFNSVALTVDGNTTAAEIVAAFEREIKAAAEAYRNSPTGNADAAEREQRRRYAQIAHDALMSKLPNLDFGNQIAVLDWLCTMQEPSDHSGVIVRRETIVSFFEARGFVAGANCGPDYRPGDRDNTFRWLVGQALSGLKSGPSIHPILHKFAGEWKEQFEKSGEA